MATGSHRHFLPLVAICSAVSGLMLTEFDTKAPGRSENLKILFGCHAKSYNLRKKR